MVMCGVVASRRAVVDFVHSDPQMGMLFAHVKMEFDKTTIKES